MCAVRFKVLREVPETCSQGGHALWRDVLPVRAADAANDATTSPTGALTTACSNSPSSCDGLQRTLSTHTFAVALRQVLQQCHVSNRTPALDPKAHISLTAAPGLVKLRSRLRHLLCHKLVMVPFQLFQQSAPSWCHVVGQQVQQSLCSRMHVAVGLVSDTCTDSAASSQHAYLPSQLGFAHTVSFLDFQHS